MKVDIVKELNKDSLLSHLILHCLTETIGADKRFEEFVGTNKTFDIKLSINNLELNIQKFIDHWQSQVHELLTKYAKELIDEKISNTVFLLDSIQEQLKSKLDDS